MFTLRSNIVTGEAARQPPPGSRKLRLKLKSKRVTVTTRALVLCPTLRHNIIELSIDKHRLK